MDDCVSETRMPACAIPPKTGLGDLTDMDKTKPSVERETSREQTPKNVSSGGMLCRMGISQSVDLSVTETSFTFASVSVSKSMQVVGTSRCRKHRCKYLLKNSQNVTGVKLEDAIPAPSLFIKDRLSMTDQSGSRQCLNISAFSFLHTFSVSLPGSKYSATTGTRAVHWKADKKQT